MNSKQRSIVALLTAGIFLAACGGLSANQEPDQNEVNGAAENNLGNESISAEDNRAPLDQGQAEEPPASAESLAAETWVLTSYGSPDQPQAILEGVVISLEYQPIQGRLGGTAGCNSYFGEVTIDEDQQLFSIGTIGMTRKACAEPIMEQESAFIRMLEKVTRYAILDGTLFLYTGSGEVLTFVPGEVPSGRQ